MARTEQIQWHFLAPVSIAKPAWRVAVSRMFSPGLPPHKISETSARMYRKTTELEVPPLT